jgi:hypothetical protein
VRGEGERGEDPDQAGGRARLHRRPQEALRRRVARIC